MSRKVKYSIREDSFLDYLVTYIKAFFEALALLACFGLMMILLLLIQR